MHSKITVVSLLALAVLTAPGCFGGGGTDGASAESGGSRRFLGFGGRSKTVAQSSANLEDLSPEASMARDLGVLRNEEQAGLRRLEELRRAGGDPALALEEEERLKEIRSRMARYSALLNRSQLAANPYPSREYASASPVIPARITERDGVRVQPYQGNPGRGEYANYPAVANTAQPVQTANYAQYAAAPSSGPVYPNLPTDYRRDSAAAGTVMPASYSPAPVAPGVNVPLREGERLIYAPQPGEMSSPMQASYTPEPAAPPVLPQERITITQPGAQPPAATADTQPAPGETRFGGATVGRANYPRRPPPARTRDNPSEKGEGEWNSPDTMFADRRQAQPTSSYPGLEQRSDERVEWPTHTPSQANRPVARPAAQSRVVAPPPAAVPVSATGDTDYTEAEGGGDEIFVPDLYLSGR
ncbi:MAG: hypothetical protein LUE17_03215 [Planctomycetaceae bacterium]|nr:hypothetical protein [Planctomycetaceae bacterium]